MYKAMSGGGGAGEGEWRDGVFAHAAPWQGYQASLTEFESGSLGAVSAASRRAELAQMALRRAQKAQAFRSGSLGLLRGASRRPLHPARLHGVSRAFQDGSLGRTFLPAFSPPQMRGLGYGDTTTIPGVPAVSITTGTPAPTPWQPDLASIGLGVVAGGLLFYFAKR